MAYHSQNPLGYYISIPKKYIEFIGELRQTSSLKVGFEEGTLWIKDLSYEMINSPQVKSIPYIQCYYEKENKLFKINSLLPSCNIPSLLWTPIQRGISIELPKENFNFFELKSEIEICIEESEIERSAVCLKTTKDVLKAYIYDAPTVRLKPLKWLKYGNNHVLILGEPLLPIIGDTFWIKNNFILPTGYSLNYPHLMELIEKKVNLRGSYILWEINKYPSCIPKNSWKPLSKSSFILSFDSFDF